MKEEHNIEPNSPPATGNADGDETDTDTNDHSKARDELQHDKQEQQEKQDDADYKEDEEYSEMDVDQITDDEAEKSGKQFLYWSGNYCVSVFKLPAQLLLWNAYIYVLIIKSTDSFLNYKAAIPCSNINY